MSTSRRHPPQSARALNRVSATITQPRSQGASQAMLLATGLTPADLNKAQIGIGSVWWEGNPCNMHRAWKGGGCVGVLPPPTLHRAHLTPPTPPRQ